MQRLAQSADAQWLAQLVVDLGGLSAFHFLPQNQFQLQLPARLASARSRPHLTTITLRARSISDWTSHALELSMAGSSAARGTQRLDDLTLLLRALGLRSNLNNQGSTAEATSHMKILNHADLRHSLCESTVCDQRA